MAFWTVLGYFGLSWGVWICFGEILGRFWISFGCFGAPKIALQHLGHLKSFQWSTSDFGVVKCSPKRSRSGPKTHRIEAKWSTSLIPAINSDSFCFQIYYNLLHQQTFCLNLIFFFSSIVFQNWKLNKDKYCLNWWCINPNNSFYANAFSNLWWDFLWKLWCVILKCWESLET